MTLAQPPNYLICADEPRVLVRRAVQLAPGHFAQLICGYMSPAAIIRAAALRGAATMRDERAVNL